MSDQLPEPHRHKLWSYFSDNHGLTLLESELEDIVRACESQLQTELTAANQRIAELEKDKELLDWILNNPSKFQLQFPAARKTVDAAINHELAMRKESNDA